ncbi:hypothetical protein FIV02_10515 [Pseudomonas sp. THAF187a]|uniref:hypothetical protein n=1 Tax=unclassified Pseudomonas TaxID=196821 RepID=UPI0012698517|nr:MULTISPECIES: hypothetical protein [unclassified Pseudomonas]QFT22008.1 hypothetical protein FIV02_10515 [Pseudomonas sp. THAF187a]QFT42195.1 hypothetical protein FIU98_10495 [Pseudomonas sp. THAF42]
MKLRLSKYCICTATLLALAGCAQGLHHNEGATQIAHSPDGKHIRSIFIPDPGNATQTNEHPIEKGEAFSIKLISAYICDFREGSGPRDWFSRSNAGALPCEGGDGNTSLLGTTNYTRGEIAIIVNAGERNDGVTGLTFNPADIQRNGRIVYYNEDIRESGQLINALNIPIYGPKTYEGGSFFMDWAILELDNDESVQSRQLLQELAKIGSAAYAPGTPVLNLLNTLGGALLGTNGDDVELRYQVEFDPPYSGVTKKDSNAIQKRVTPYAPLREGYYVIVREENRDQLPPFEKLRVSQGKYNPLLAIKNAPNQPYRLYKDRSWLLVRVAREDHAKALTQDASTTAAQLLEQLSKVPKTSAQYLEVLSQAIEEAQKGKPKTTSNEPIEKR